MAVLFISSELKTIDINRKCSNQELSLTWLNTIGGWEHWTFTARKTESYNMRDVQTITRDILEDWDTEFIGAQTEREHISLEANESLIVRSQNLTAQQVRAIARIKFSIKVQDMTDPLKPITVIVDKASIDYTTDKNKTNFIEFAISYPSIIIQEQ